VGVDEAGPVFTDVMGTDVGAIAVVVKAAFRRRRRTAVGVSQVLVEDAAVQCRRAVECQRVIIVVVVIVIASRRTRGVRRDQQADHE
jgi:hypothetical protein